jgi:glycerol uptake facilitator protein
MNHKPTLVAELIAEFLGTFVLILFGCGVVAMVVLFPQTLLPRPFTAAIPTSPRAGDWR